MTKNSRNHQTFGSAYDMPSIRELQKQLRGFKVLSMMAGGRQKEELAAAQKLLDDTVGIVDGFYALLGERNWVYHDDMNLPAMQEIVDAENPDAAEKLLIAYYMDRTAMKFPLLRLNRLAAIRPRLELVQNAYKDFQAGRYYATVLTLITVMDGAVNDIDQGQRKGLHARNTDEMIAWDSVTAHHLGLKHAHETFTKSFRKTVTDEVRELYRHGIVHGMVVNYDNVVVAAKSLNRLFAVVDWAINLLEQDEPVTKEPTFRELMAQSAQTQRDIKLIDAFSPSEHEVQDDHDLGDEVVDAARKYLEAWRSTNYGSLSDAFMRVKGDADSPGRRASEAKDLYKDFALDNYLIKRVQHTAACVSLLDADLAVNDKEYQVSLRWVRTDDQGEPAPRGKSGSWKLSMYGPTNFIRDIH